MSSLGRWTYTSTLTIWPVTFDDYSQVVYGTPYTIDGSWMQGGEMQSNSDGTQFVPTSTYYFEALDGATEIPKPEAYILRGDNTATVDPTTIGAEKIKKVGGWDMSPFGNEIPDWVLYS